MKELTVTLGHVPVGDEVEWSSAQGNFAVGTVIQHVGPEQVRVRTKSGVLLTLPLSRVFPITGPIAAARLLASRS